MKVKKKFCIFVLDGIYEEKCDWWFPQVYNWEQLEETLKSNPFRNRNKWRHWKVFFDSYEQARGTFRSNFDKSGNYLCIFSIHTYKA